jgi:hypothetical protein
MVSSYCLEENGLKGKCHAKNLHRISFAVLMISLLASPPHTEAAALPGFQFLAHKSWRVQSQSVCVV